MYTFRDTPPAHYIAAVAHLQIGPDAAAQWAHEATDPADLQSRIYWLTVANEDGVRPIPRVYVYGFTGPAPWFVGVRLSRLPELTAVTANPDAQRMLANLADYPHAWAGVDIITDGGPARSYPYQLDSTRIWPARHELEVIANAVAGSRVDKLVISALVEHWPAESSAR